MNKLLLLFVYSCWFGFNKAQGPILDSLISDFKHAKHDTTRASLYVEFTEILYMSNPDTVIPLCNKAIDICDKYLTKESEKLKSTYLRIKSSALNNIGYIHQNKNNIKEALDNYFQSLKIQEQIMDFKGRAQSLNNIGFVYQMLEDTLKAFYYYEQSLKFRQQIKDSSGIAQCYNNLGLMYRKFGDPNCKSSIVEVRRKAGNEKALNFYLQSLEIKKAVNDKQGIAIALNNIGSIYNALGDLGEAMKYFKESLSLRTELNDRSGISISYNNLGGIFLKQKKYKEAEESCIKSLIVAKEIKFTDNIRRAAETLYKIYKVTGKFDKALEMHEMFINMRDSLSKNDSRIDAEKQHYKAEYEIKAAADSVRVEEERKRVELQLEHNRISTYFLIFGLILVLIFAAIIFSRFRITKKQKTLIEIKEQETQQQKILLEHRQKEIVDSINYAQRIQKALLASDNILQNNLPEHFIYYKPKAIVSGDFYWATLIHDTNDLRKSESFCLAVCDSTGHGVPGAFMSLLNISFLNEAVNEKKLISPGKILNHVRNRLIQNLSAEESKDGMDCSIALFDFKNNKMQFAAANNQIWVVRKNKIVELIELKADKMPVGKHEKDQTSFSESSFDLKKGDMVYLFTDGYPDQFGGERGKKFMYKQFQDLIISINSENTESQKRKLAMVFDNWKGNLEQVDDLCIIGIRI